MQRADHRDIQLGRFFQNFEYLGSVFSNDVRVITPRFRDVEVLVGGKDVAVQGA